VRAGFEVDVKCCAARGCTGTFERNYFRVLPAVVGVKSFINNTPSADDHRSDDWIRRSERNTAARELQSARHPKNVSRLFVSRRVN
jgi:hypothetical protein